MTEIFNTNNKLEIFNTNNKLLKPLSYKDY